MKQQEAARLSKIVDELAKVHALLAEQKMAAALKKVASLHAKLSDKVASDSKPAKPRAPTKYNLFVSKEYPGMAARYPNDKATEIMKRLALLYKGEAVSPLPAKTKAVKATKVASGTKKARKPRAKKN